jgi:hypothetical protein
VKVPIRGWDKPYKMLSWTEQDILGQKRISFGSGALNSIKVFRVGSEPAIFGSVLRFSRFAPSAGGTILLKLNTMKAF